jgi:cytoskeletal protein CcmA (bactofilin family)
MQQENRSNLLISGIGSSNGGTVRSAKIDGIGKVNGDISCSNFTVNGKAEIHGSIKAETAEVNGTALVEGSLRADRIRIHGKISVDGDLIGDNIQINGTSTVKGNCETEKFEASGKFQMGTLNAGKIHITLHGSSQIAEIGGEHIQIRKQPGIDFAKWLKVLPIRFGNKLTAQTIEGDYVYVEFTTAEVIRGKSITIGPGCNIGLVEYTTKFDQDKGSAVKSVERI